jgi:hypothetical protein
MSGETESLVLEQLRLIREEQRAIREEMSRGFGAMKSGIKTLRTAIGAQSVMLTGVAGYVHELETRVDVLEGEPE